MASLTSGITSILDLINPWFIAALAFALMHWTSRLFGWMRISTATKIPVTLSLIMWSLTYGGWTNGKIWFGAGLIFSLAWDVLLLSPRRFFNYGLISFLLAHVSYIIGFCQPGPVLHPILIGLGWFLFIGGFYYYKILIHALMVTASNERFIIPVVVYGLVVSLMAISACQTFLRPDWPKQAAFFAASGGFLFLISDSLLGYNRFVHPLPGGKALEMVMYHLAQVSIIAAMLLR
jgi:alkenylglycerophosphocholine hydrolase